MEFFDTPSFDYDAEKKKFIDNMNFLKGMDVTSQTFYKKWYEVQNYKDFVSKSSLVKAKIWTPSDLNNEQRTLKEIENLNPVVKYVEGKDLESDWLILRVFGHTMEFSQTPGRFLKLLVTAGGDDNRYLGVISVSSDVISISDRDNYIGWDVDAKLKKKRINNSAIGSCIMSTQPFGYNFLGGKLIACLITTSVIRDIWKNLYNDILAGMSTTSLYGSYSMYNNLNKWWHKCGSSTGKIPLKPDDTFYETWHHWLQENKPLEYKKAMTQKEGVSGPVTGAKQRILTMIFSQLGMKHSDYVHGYSRGVYYSTFYENSREFLQDKISEDKLIMKPAFKADKQLILDWWKVKACQRYLTLKKENRLKPEILFYNKMMGMSYDESKKLYFNEVGR